MPHIIKAPSAELDLYEIWGFIADDSPSRADAFLDRLEEAIQIIATQPQMGRLRDDLDQGLRMHAVGDYVIYYYPIPDGIEISRVLNAARDRDALL